MDDLVQKIEIR